MAVATYTKTGTKATTPAKLDKTVFGVEVKNHQLLKDAYLSYLAKGRTNNALTKKRGQVRGSTIKPWRQKGTGNARFGSRYNPIWRGGGVAFGPTGQENYTRKMSLATRRQALRQALSLAAEENRIKVIETFACPDGKVKPTIQLLSKMDVKGSALIVVPVKDSLMQRATRNLPKIKVVAANYLNTFEVMNFETIIISREALAVVNEKLGNK